MVLDFHSKDKKGEDSTSVVSASGTGSDGGTKNKHQHHDNQGLSIEEMSAGTIRETLLQQKNRLVSNSPNYFTITIYNITIMIQEISWVNMPID
jgi:hypothetical protein